MKLTPEQKDELSEALSYLHGGIISVHGVATKLDEDASKAVHAFADAVKQRHDRLKKLLSLTEGD